MEKMAGKENTTLESVLAERMPLQDLNCREPVGQSILSKMGKKIEHSEAAHLSAPTPTISHHSDTQETHSLTTGQTKETETEIDGITALTCGISINDLENEGQRNSHHVQFTSVPEMIVSSAQREDSPRIPGDTQPHTPPLTGTIGTSPHPTPLPLRLGRGLESGGEGEVNRGGGAYTQHTRTIGCSPIKVPVEHYECHSSASETTSPQYKVTGQQSVSQGHSDQEVTSEESTTSAEQEETTARLDLYCERETAISKVSTEFSKINFHENSKQVVSSVKGGVLSEEAGDCESAEGKCKKGRVSAGLLNTVQAGGDGSDKTSTTSHVQGESEAGEASERQLSSVRRQNIPGNSGSGDKSVEIEENGPTCGINDHTEDAAVLWGADLDLKLENCVHSQDNVDFESDLPGEDAWFSCESVGSLCRETEVKGFSAGREVRGEGGSSRVRHDHTAGQQHSVSQSEAESGSINTNKPPDTRTSAEPAGAPDCSMNGGVQATESVSTSTEYRGMDHNYSSNTSVHDNISTATNRDLAIMIGSSVNTRGAEQSVTCQRGGMQCEDSPTNKSFQEGGLFGQELVEGGGFQKDLVVKETVSVAVATSPSRLNMGRPSDVGLAGLSHEELRLQFETACISNTLLRQELSEKQTEVAAVTRELSSLRERDRDGQTSRLQLEREVKVALEAEISCLCGRLAGSEGEVRALQARLTEQAGERERAEVRLRQSVDFLKSENSSLQTDLKRLYTQRGQQIEALRREYAENDYKRLYLRSEERVREAEARLDAFTGLVTTLQEAHQSQLDTEAALETGSVCLKERTEAVRRDRQVLQTQLADWQEEKRLAREEVRVTRLQNEALRNTVDGQKKTVEDRDRQIEQMKGRLTEYIGRLAEMEEERDAQRSVNLHLTQELHAARREVEEACAARRSLQAELQQGRSASQSLQHIADQLTHKLTTVTSEVEKFQEERENMSSFKENCVAESGLVGKELEEVRAELVDSRQDVARLERERAEQGKRVSRLQNQLSRLHRQAEEDSGVRATLTTVQDHLQSVQDASKESQLFSELEVSTLREALEETRRQCDMLDKMAATSEEQRAGLEERLTTESARVSDLQAELDYTKTQAHMMLLEQGDELSSAAQSLEKLAHTMDGLLAELSGREEAMHTQAASCDESLAGGNVTDSEKLGQCEGGPGGSLLSSVMRAIGGEATPPQGIRLTTSQGQHNRGTSLDSQHQDTGVSLDRVSPASPTDLSADTTPQSPSLDEAGSGGVHAGKGIEGGLSEQIEGLGVTLAQVITTVTRLDRIMTAKQEAVKHECLHLEASLLAERAESARQTRLCEERVRGAELQAGEARRAEKETKSQLSEARQEVTEREGELRVTRKLLQAKCTALEERVEQAEALQRCRGDVLRLEAEVSACTSARRVAEESLEGALRALEDREKEAQMSTPGAGDRKYARENYFLKREVEDLKQQLGRAQEGGESLASRANHRHKILQHNLSKAEQEIVGLDSTVERLRQLLRRHRGDVRLWADAKHVWNEVVYDKRLDGPDMLWK